MNVFIVASYSYINVNKLLIYFINFLHDLIKQLLKPNTKNVGINIKRPTTILSKNLIARVKKKEKNGL